MSAGKCSGGGVRWRTVQPYLAGPRTSPPELQSPGRPTRQHAAGDKGERVLVAGVRAVCLGLAITVFALAVPLQWLLARFWPGARHRLPMLFHRAICAAAGLRVRVTGNVCAQRPLLVIANHVSWLDIPAFGGVAPLSFLAKTEVGDWPVIGIFARLQGCVFVDRNRRRGIAQVNAAITASLRAGNVLVLFAEGTTGDGNRLLRFCPPHFEAAIGASSAAQAAWLQPVAITYTHRNGLLFERRTRPGIAWYGAMALLPHLWAILRGGPVDCELRYGTPLPVRPDSRRKALALLAQREIRACLAGGRPADVVA